MKITRFPIIITNSLQKIWKKKKKNYKENTHNAATHSNVLAWRVPWTEEPGGLQSVGLWGVRHDWATFTCYFHKENGASQVVWVAKNLPANAGDLRNAGSIPGLGRFPVEEQGGPLQYCCLDNLMDRGAWWVKIHWLEESDMTEVT